MSAETVLNGVPGPPRRRLSRRIRPILLGVIGTLVVLKIVALTPAPLEQTGTTPRVVDLDELILREGNTLATGIPKGKIPDYTIDQFNYVSTQNSQPEWNLIAREAFVFNKESLVHARVVKANLYDTDGQITVVTGQEAKYLTKKSDIEIFGNVKTTFPDGFVVKSDYLRYQPKKHKIEIPVSYPVAGEGVENKDETIHFVSRGLKFDSDTSEIYLPQNVKFTVDQGKSRTLVLSDHCLIHRKENIADFTMSRARPAESRFVQIEQPTMYARGRTGKLKYGKGNTVQAMSLFDDVFVQEFKLKKGAKKITRYGTGGRADFDSKRNTIILTIYPQVYQGDDTLTGDKITLHRQSDIVEVEHSNGFSTGADSEESQP